MTSLQSRLLGTLDPVTSAEPEAESRISVLQPQAHEPVETPVDPYAELRLRIHHACIAKLGPELFNRARSPHELDRLVRATVAEELSTDPTPLSREERQRIEQSVTDDLLGYGPLQPLLGDDSVSEIMVNGPTQVYVERAGRIELENVFFADDAHLMRVIDKIVSQVGRRIDEASPMVDARLPDGSRVNAIIPPLALCGPTLTIRKFSRRPYQLVDLVRFGTLTEPAAEFLAECVRGKLNVLVSGGTGVGKTTLLNALSAFIPETERIVTIEDSAELQLLQRHVIPLEARPPNVEGKGEIRIRELVRNALRMRPDRLVVGEVRGPETLDMLQAMNTGHDGSLTTIHANSPRDALSRLETLVLTAGVDLPLRAIREQIASAFDLIIQVSRLIDGTRRVTHVTEVAGLESEVVATQDVFHALKPTGATDGTELLGTLVASGVQPGFLSKAASNGVRIRPDLFEPPGGLF